MNLGVITYEQPMNEQMRLNLRLEQLFQQLDHHMQAFSRQNSQFALETITAIMGLTDRPDLKTKLAQTLSQQVNSLMRLEQSPDVDAEKLQDLLHRLDCLVDVLNRGGRGKFAEELRDNIFLKNIQQQLLHHAASAHISSPAYLLWLHQSEQQREQDLRQWSQVLQPMRDAVNYILYLLRHTATKQSVNATNTFYQQSLNANLSCQMVRITLPVNYGVYPRTSVGRHRLSIRFEALQTEFPFENKQKVRAEFPFELSCCYT